MRFPEVVRNSDETSTSPVWARSKRKRGPGAGPFIGFLVTLLALFGALTGVMAVKERSVAAGGAVIDGWISTGVQTVMKAAGKAPAAATVAADKAGATAEKTGDALQAGAAETADQMKAAPAH
jgi:hypothetical protein